MNRAIQAVISMTAAILTGLPLQAQSGLGTKLITEPGLPTVWGSAVQTHKDKTVKGGLAMRIATNGAETSAADIGFYMPIRKAVHKGDRLAVVFWARLVQGTDDTATRTVSYSAIQLSTPPFTSVFQGQPMLTKDWTALQVSGLADKDYDAGTLTLAVQLGRVKRVVDVGPAYAFDLDQPS